MRGGAMVIVVVGVDFAKNDFHLHAVDKRGRLFSVGLASDARGLMPYESAFAEYS
jgi:hypothetical protein